MALFSLWQFPSSPLSPSRNSVNYPKISPTLNPISNFTTTNKNHGRLRLRLAVVVNAAEEQQKPPVAESETSRKPPSDEELSELGSEIKKAMLDREIKAADESIWAGVVEEIGRIEWPAFNKVIGTTGVVLAVIAGSSVVLLTVNAVLAEISDQVFAGRGVQDFFG